MWRLFMETSQTVLFNGVLNVHFMVLNRFARLVRKHFYKPLFLVVFSLRQCVPPVPCFYYLFIHLLLFLSFFFWGGGGVHFLAGPAVYEIFSPPFPLPFLRWVPAASNIPSTFSLAVVPSRKFDWSPIINLAWRGRRWLLGICARSLAVFKGIMSGGWFASHWQGWSGPVGNQALRRCLSPGVIDHITYLGNSTPLLHCCYQQLLLACGCCFYCCCS